MSDLSSFLNITSKFHPLDSLTHPVLAPLLSISFYLGLRRFGLFLSEKLRINFFLPEILPLSLLPFFIGTLVCLQLSIGEWMLKAFGTTIIIIGLFSIIENLRSFLINNPRKQFLNFFKTSKILGILFIILSIFPFSDADSVAYHMALPIQLLISGSLSKIWLHGMLTGYGEFTSLLGLSLGIDNLNSIIQSMTFFFFVEFLIKEFRLKPENSLRLVFYSFPILLFLIPNQKLQLLGIIFSVIFAIKLTEVKSRTDIIFLGFISALLVGIKLSFLIDIVAIPLAYLFSKQETKRWKIIILIGIIGGFSLTPLLAYKYQFFGNPLAPFHLIFSEDKVVYDQFYTMVKDFRDSPLSFPFSLLLPASPGYVSTIIGLPILFFLFKKPKKNYFYILFVITFLFNLILSQNTTRFFLLPTFFGLIYFFNNFSNSKFEILFRNSVIAQSLIVLILTLASVLVFSPSLIGPSYRKVFYSNRAYGYQIAKELNETIFLEGGRLILEKGLRIHSFLKRSYFPDDLAYYLENKPFLLEQLKNDENKKLFYVATSKVPSYLTRNFEVKKKKSFNTTLATRNPFNQAGMGRIITIYELKLDQQ
jgi:hypothetical protein